MNNVNISCLGFVRLWMIMLTTLAKPQAWRLAWLIGLLWVGVMVSRADTHYVALGGTNDSVNGYITWPGAATNIQWAVDKAVTFDTVLISNGTYNLTDQISILTNITVRSLNGTNFTFVNGNYPAYTNRCFYMTNGVLDGFTISNGFITNDHGGGIKLISSGSVYNCYIYGNVVSNSVTLRRGGGIYMDGGVVSNCTVVSNSNLPATGDRYGGGVCLYNSGGLLIDSYIYGNISGSGGGVAAISGGRITNCTIAGNSTTNKCGGVYLQNVTDVAMANCVISNNSAPSYGGMQIYGGKVINSTIIANRATGESGNLGAGVGIDHGSLLSNCQVIANIAGQTFGGVGITGGANYTNVVTDCIIYNNSATYGGGGLRIESGGLAKNCLIYCNSNYSSAYYGGGVFLKNNALRTNEPYGLINCTIVNNKGYNGGGIGAEGISNYVVNCIIVSNVNAAGAQDDIYNITAANTNNFWYNCTPTNPTAGQGNITNNPLFINAWNRNYRLSSGSPCINTGTNMSLMTGTVDLDGRARIRYGRVDMGAYEAIYSGTMYGFR